ncbi:hypothetical protein T03_439 [Trichinella britovi]|uniref:Uncharacterized protein n=1 Tax=Trichinella britovi TaxID=45882 RepID=A0A0V1D6X5_TRIBR|nr:hypothetical protein T03_439 [Trichinella britovi]
MDELRTLQELRVDIERAVEIGMSFEFWQNAQEQKKIATSWNQKTQCPFVLFRKCRLICSSSSWYGGLQDSKSRLKGNSCKENCATQSDTIANDDNPVSTGGYPRAVISAWLPPALLPFLPASRFPNDIITIKRQVESIVHISNYEQEPSTIRHTTLGNFYCEF